MVVVQVEFQKKIQARGRQWVKKTKWKDKWERQMGKGQRGKDQGDGKRDSKRDSKRKQIWTISYRPYLMYWQDPRFQADSQ